MDDALPPRSVLLVLETAGAPEVLLFAPGMAEGLSIDLNPVQSFRHHRAAAVLVGDLPAVEGSWLVVGYRRIEVDAEAGVMELSFTEQGWEEGLVAMAPMPVLPFEDTVWQVPLVGWSSWFGLVPVLALAAWRAR